jgi:hypothetical protein
MEIFRRFAEALDAVTLPIRAFGYEVSRFFSPPPPTPAVQGRGAGVAIACILGMLVHPFVGIGVLVTLLPIVMTINYLSTARDEISPRDDEDIY